MNNVSSVFTRCNIVYNESVVYLGDYTEIDISSLMTSTTVKRELLARPLLTIEDTRNMYVYWRWD